MIIILLVLIFLIFVHSSTIVLQGANVLGRRCISPEVKIKEHGESLSGLKIAMVSFLDEESNGEVRVSESGLMRWPMKKSSRSFEGLMGLVKTNKQAYATKWGYDFIDARSCIDRSRPASWSKIPSVRSHLHGYDWVFWNDADSVVTNPNIRLERILQHATVMNSNTNEQNPDLIITEDVNGVNAGMFFLRRSKWSEGFLDTWWNMSSFILRGSKKSGDNAALIHLINSLSPSEKLRNVHVAEMQCIFNSYPWVPTWKNFYRFLLSPCSFWKGIRMERYHRSFNENSPRKNSNRNNDDDDEDDNNNIMRRNRNYMSGSYFVRRETSYGSFLAGVSWPPRSYACSFCKREFRSAQALGGHMNVHRRDRARLRDSSPWDPPSSLLDEPNSNTNTRVTNPNPKPKPKPKPADKIIEEERSTAATISNIPNLNLIPDLVSDTTPFSPPPWALQRFPSYVPSKPLYSSSGAKHVSTRPRSSTMKTSRVLFGVEEDRLLRRKMDIVRLDLKIGLHESNDDDLAGDEMDLELRLGY
ncbi:hypothetical protein ZOSMA_1G03330 [Zostera marina]|uniref:C2H2-type domain-containing protein n=1 Tax=Zostera marina TaxID=29655 RepID=A0A0K9PN00_ZOSMR|nr:hypothetical protein ZOSMA_1G03330 [Zostera marina]